MDPSVFAIFPASAMATEKKVVSGDVVVSYSRGPNACLCIGCSRSCSDDAKSGKHNRSLRQQSADYIST